MAAGGNKGPVGWRRWATLLAALSAAVLIILGALASGPAEGALRQARSAQAFVDSIGVNTHLNYFDSVYGNYPLVKSKLTALGVRHARDRAHLSSDPNYNQKMYGMYKNLAASGVRFNLIVDLRFSNLRSVDGQKVSKIAGMAGASLNSFEGPNEYNKSGDAAWASTLTSYQRDLYASVKGNASTAKVPVIAGAVGRPYPSVMPDLSASVDYGNARNYPGSRAIPEITTYNITEARKVSGTKPLVVTETGYHNATQTTDTHAGVSERAAGRYVPRLFLENFSRGVKRTFSYELFDLGQDADNNERDNNFGLVRNDGTQKPAYNTMKNMIGLLEDPGPAFSPAPLDYALSGDATNVRQVLLQKRDGRFYLVLWQETPSYDFANKRDVAVPSRGVTLTVNRAVRNAAVYLPNSSAAPVGSYAGPRQLSLKVPDHPLIVEITP